MKYMLDRIAAAGLEWRLIGNTDDTIVEVHGPHGVDRYLTARQAMAAILPHYKRAADFRNMQVGQTLQLPMADGTQKTVNVTLNDGQAMTVTDPTTGEQFQIPHMDKTKSPSVMTNPNQDQSTPDGATIQPGTGMVTIGRTAKNEGREPYHCKHDQTYLRHKNPSDPEKYCTQCGMVYAAEKEPMGRILLSQKDYEVTERDLYRGPRYAVDGTQILDRKYTNGQWWYLTRSAGTREWVTELPTRIALSATDFAKVAAPPMPGNQAMPQSDNMNDGELAPDRQEQDFVNQEEPAYVDDASNNPAAGNQMGRLLTKHEIVEEAETLIRNALWKGVKIGVNDLVKFMQQEYSNAPEELYAGCTLAWEKVEYEDKDNNNNDEMGIQQGPAGGGPEEMIHNIEPDLEDEESGPLQVKLQREM